MHHSQNSRLFTSSFFFLVGGKREKNDNSKYIPPPPLMIFSSKLKVGQRYRDKSCHYQENDKHYKQDAVYSVNPVSPYTGKNIIKFNIYGTKWQKSSHCHLRNCPTVPLQRWNFSRIFSGAARSLELSLAILPCNPTQHQQRGCYKCPYENYNHNRPKWKSSSCMISNCNSI